MTLLPNNRQHFGDGVGGSRRSLASISVRIKTTVDYVLRVYLLCHPFHFLSLTFPGLGLADEVPAGEGVDCGRGQAAGAVHQHHALAVLRLGVVAGGDCDEEWGGEGGRK